MDSRPEYPQRVTRGPDGIYRWTYRISQRQNRRALRITIAVVGGVCVIMTAMAATLDVRALAVTVLSCGAAMLITLLVCAVVNRLSAGGIPQPFEVAEDYVRWVGSGRTDFRYSYSSLRRVRILPSEDIIELRQLLGVMQVYIPHEDFALVQGLILSRLPDGADVEYV